MENAETDVASIVATVERLRQDDSLRPRLADGARRFALQRHGINRNRTAMIEYGDVGEPQSYTIAKMHKTMAGGPEENGGPSLLT